MKLFGLLVAGLILTALAAGADDVSGPGRTTQIVHTWGTVYVNPAKVSSYSTGSSFDGQIKIQTSGGEVKVSSGATDPVITWPDGSTIKVNEQLGEVRVDAQGKSYNFRSTLNSLEVKTPNDTIKYDRGLDGVTINGTQGTVNVRRALGTTSITSKAGTTELKSTLGGETRSGVPASQHPYVFSGMIFERGGVGVFIDFDRLNATAGLLRAFDELQWDYMVLNN